MNESVSESKSMSMNMSPDEIGAPSQGARKRILIACDEPETNDLLLATLQKEGYESLDAATADEAFARVMQEAPNLTIIDMTSPSLDGQVLYRRLRAEATLSLMPILMLAMEEDLTDRLGALRPDLDDYVTKPLRPQALVYRIKHLLARVHLPPRQTSEPLTRGRIIAFCSNKGGVGKTLLSVNLAVALRQRTGKRVAIVDGDFFYGNVGTYLGVPPVRSIMDLIAVVDELDVEIADRVLIRHSSGIRVLLSPPRPDQAAEITPDHLRRLLEFLSTIYDYIVVDCQTVIDSRLMPALELASDIMLVCTPEMGCLKNMRVLLDQFVDVGIDLKKMHVVLNRAATNVEIEVKDIEQAFKQKVAFSLSSGGRSVVLSINRGVPLIMEQPKHPISQQIMHMADYFLLQAPPRPLTRGGKGQSTWLEGLVSR
jgi:pilus assembly protein CpaE